MFYLLSIKGDVYYACDYFSFVRIHRFIVATHKNSLKMTYDKYSNRVCKIRDLLKLNPDHRAHDGRNHFITMAKKAGIDEYALKYIVGHAIQDVTERVYTQREISWLIEEMQKIK